MKRRLLNFLTLVSLALGCMAVGLWVRSYFVNDTVHVFRPYRYVIANSRGGSVRIDETPSAWPGGYTADWWHTRNGWTPRPLNRLAEFRLGGMRRPPYWHVVFPHWALVVPCFLLPAGRLLLRARRRHRPDHGFPVDAAVTVP